VFHGFDILSVYSKNPMSLFDFFPLASITFEFL
jgi:hypothetical protein